MPKYYYYFTFRFFFLSSSFRRSLATFFISGTLIAAALILQLNINITRSSSYRFLQRSYATGSHACARYGCICIDACGLSFGMHAMVYNGSEKEKKLPKRTE